MALVVLLVLLVLLFPGPYYGYRAYGYPGGISVGGFLLILIVVLLLFGY